MDQPAPSHRNQQPLFELGRLMMTPGVESNTTVQDRITAIRKHVCGQWGDIPDEDVQQNERAVEQGERILSSYVSSMRQRFWVITEADRSVTTLLLPEEY